MYVVDVDHDLVKVPFFIWSRTIPTDAGSKMRAKPVAPKQNRFAASDDATLCQKILNISRAERIVLIRSDGVVENFARET